MSPAEQMFGITGILTAMALWGYVVEIRLTYRAVESRMRKGGFWTPQDLSDCSEWRLGAVKRVLWLMHRRGFTLRYKLARGGVAYRWVGK